METRLRTQQRVAPPPSFTPVRRGLLQRKCTCGGTPGPTGECEVCRKKRLQRKIDNAGQTQNASTAPPIVHEVLRSPGLSLDLITRSFMEPRFGHDFGNVRVHTDARAAKSARAVNAQAYTVGRNIVFGRGEYIPATTQGRRLIAHELAHVVQQNGTLSKPAALRISPEGDGAETEAQIAARQIDLGSNRASVTSQCGVSVRRKLRVDKPADKIPNPGGKGVVQTNADTIKNYLATLCAGGSATVNAGSGVVGIDPSFCSEGFMAKLGMGPSPATPAVKSYLATPTGCGCICDIANSTNDWTIKIDDASWPHTNFTDQDAANGKKIGVGSGGIVTAPSPNSPKLWGTATAGGKELDIDPWLVLGHELCGHAWLGNIGSHGPDETSPRGEGGHQETIARENELRKEHGIELRGTFKQPNCGESYWRDKGAPGKVNWSDFRKVCEAWRAEHNKKNKTAFKITDTIP